MPRKDGPSSPRTSTIKRLFALSGNQCAFPQCESLIVDREKGLTLGEIAHIKAENPTGSRYDENQSNEERHGFANLILLCRPHHTEVDADTDNYTVKSLCEMKEKHESAMSGEPVAATDEIADDLRDSFLIQISAENAVVSIGQVGGQTALNITNVVNMGPPQRKLSRDDAESISAFLRKQAPMTIRLCHVHGSQEATELAHALRAAFIAGGWTVEAVDVEMSPELIKGIQFRFPKDSTVARTKNVADVPPAFDGLATIMKTLGLSGGNVNLTLNGPAGGRVTVFVGLHP